MEATTALSSITYNKPIQNSKSISNSKIIRTNQNRPTPEPFAVCFYMLFYPFRSLRNIQMAHNLLSLIRPCFCPVYSVCVSINTYLDSPPAITLHFVCLLPMGVAEKENDNTNKRKKKPLMWTVCVFEYAKLYLCRRCLDVSFIVLLRLTIQALSKVNVLLSTIQFQFNLLCTKINVSSLSAPTKCCFYFSLCLSTSSPSFSFHSIRLLYRFARFSS